MAASRTGYMKNDLSRLMRPASIAIIGGGAWCRAVLAQLIKAGFEGDIWPVHPNGGDIDGMPVFTSVADLPFAPDAAFVGINRHATIEIVEALRRSGAGGAVCFASGFAEVGDGHDLNAALLRAAGDIPILGPNCYGFINAFDGALLWPDQHGCKPVARGVAILTQSSNIAINLTMQARGLPIGYVVTCGNQAQTTQAQIAMSLLDDPRVTAIGLHIEGFGDSHAWQNFMRAAHAKSVPVVAVKVGKSQQAQSATISHTASLAGGDVGAQAFLDRLGIGRVDDLSTLLEALKILHINGPLNSANIATISCSGGEASLAADLAHDLPLTFPPLNPNQTTALAEALGPKVALANPLDYHTYIWRDTDAMTAAFSAMVDPQLAITMLIVDFPRADRCDPSDWDCVIDAAIATRAKTRSPIAMVATLPELLPETVADHLLEHGVIPLHGLRAALGAVCAAQPMAAIDLDVDVLRPPAPLAGMTLTEAQSKAQLNAFGVTTPRQVFTDDIDTADLKNLSYPVVLKGSDIAHKTEAGAVALNLMDPDAVRNAARSMPTQSFLIEEMVSGTVAELLIGVVKDPAHGFTLSIGAGGVLTELLQDSETVLVPASRLSIEQCLKRLKVSKLLTGYRGAPPANVPAIIDAILGIQDYVLANANTVEEVEVNPLMCTPNGAIAADALIRIAK